MASGMRRCRLLYEGANYPLLEREDGQRSRDREWGIGMDVWGLEVEGFRPVVGSGGVLWEGVSAAGRSTREPTRVEVKEENSQACPYAIYASTVLPTQGK